MLTAMLLFMVMLLFYAPSYVIGYVCFMISCVRQGKLFTQSDWKNI